MKKILIYVVVLVLSSVVIGMTAITNPEVSSLLFLITFSTIICVGYYDIIGVLFGEELASDYYIGVITEIDNDGDKRTFLFTYNEATIEEAQKKHIMRAGMWKNHEPSYDGNVFVFDGARVVAHDVKRISQETYDGLSAI